MKVDIFIPCHIDQIFPDTARNMIRVLEKLGCVVNYNIEQTCCGMPAFQSGHWDVCKEVGTKFIHDFLDDRYIVTPSAACVGMVKYQYAELFHNSVLHNEYKHLQKKVYEFSDFLVNVLKAGDLGAKLKARVAYIDSCSSLRVCKIKEEPRLLLRNVKYLEMLEVADSDTCCGYGGQCSVEYKSMANDIARRKLQAIRASGAEIVCSNEMTCLMHLENNRDEKDAFRFMHLADVLAMGY